MGTHEIKACMGLQRPKHVGRHRTREGEGRLVERVEEEASLCSSPLIWPQPLPPFTSRLASSAALMIHFKGLSERHWFYEMLTLQGHTQRTSMKASGDEVDGIPQKFQHVRGKKSWLLREGRRLRPGRGATDFSCHVCDKMWQRGGGECLVQMVRSQAWVC